ncbi:MAG TPA: hypothetical protein VGH42_14515 [Verrucomicrobiae bacterium]
MNAPANDVANLADDVVDGMTGNPAFPTPPIPVAGLTTLNTTLRTAITAADAGGPTQTAAKNKAYAAVTDALRKDANYVEIQSDNDLETLLSSGYDVVSTNQRAGAARPAGGSLKSPTWRRRKSSSACCPSSTRSRIRCSLPRR